MEEVSLICLPESLFLISSNVSWFTSVSVYIHPWPWASVTNKLWWNFKQLFFKYWQWIKHCTVTQKKKPEANGKNIVLSNRVHMTEGAVGSLLNLTSSSFLFVQENSKSHHKPNPDKAVKRKQSLLWCLSFRAVISRTQSPQTQMHRSERPSNPPPPPQNSFKEPSRQNRENVHTRLHQTTVPADSSGTRLKWFPGSCGTK